MWNCVQRFPITYPSFAGAEKSSDAQSDGLLGILPNSAESIDQVYISEWQGGGDQPSPGGLYKR